MIEPEEIIESKVADLLDAANPGLAVVGALEPSADGTEKVAPLSHIGVFADLATQDLDWKGPGCPCSYSVRVAVRVAFADDKSGAKFRATCRAVRGALAALTGDGCAALDGEGFNCDAFILDTTSTTLGSIGDGEDQYKTYTATIHGRFIPPTNETEALNG